MLSTSSTPHRLGFKQNLLLNLYLIVFFVTWVLTLVYTSDIVNWCIENVLTFLFLYGLAKSYKTFKFSNLSYTFIFVYLMLHIYGAQHTYAENPFGYWLKDFFGLERNHYDRIVHFSFGFMLAYPMRDYFLNWFKWPVWVCFVLPAEITLSFSGLYEIIEWLVADIFFKSHGAAYLGTQGDIWDAQKDMALAFCGAALVMFFAFFAKLLVKK